MDPSASLDLISNDKIHHFFLFLPLLTMLLLKAKVFLIVAYTIIWALAEVYIINLIAFKNLSAKAVISPPDPKRKLKPTEIFGFLQKNLWFIKDVWLFVVLMFVICGTFLITFILSIVYLRQEYMLYIMLAHIFLGVFMWRLLKVIGYLSSLTQVKEKFKYGK